MHEYCVFEAVAKELCEDKSDLIMAFMGVANDAPTNTKLQLGGMTC